MKYDFNKVYNRKNTDSIKWNNLKSIFGSEEVIPLWVADMDFPAAQPIIEALRQRAEHPFYGYAQPGAGVIQSVVERVNRKFDWQIQPEWIVFTPGVIPALHTAIRALTHPGDKIIIQQPVYFPFFAAITGSGCEIVNNGLKLVNGAYEMCFNDLQSKLTVKSGMMGEPNRIKALLLCNPHNPVGRVWTKEDLTMAGEIAIRNGAVVISDEIHCEILFKGGRHTPFASISPEFAQNCIVCMSPSKTFSLAGLEVSSIIIPNKKIRDAFLAIRSGLVPGPNIFGYAAMEAAYRYGDEWLEQVLDYLQGNLDFMMSYFTNKIPRIKVIRPYGTYLVWLDCRALAMDDRALSKFLIEKARLGLDDGTLFGDGGSGFMRMNIACPRSLLMEALQRLETAVNGL